MHTDQKAPLPVTLQACSLNIHADNVRHYAKLTADFNPIHLDSAFAASTVFGTPIIHGTMGLNLIIEAIDQTLGYIPPGLEVDVRFVRPVHLDQTIRAEGTLLDAETGTYNIFLKTESEEHAIEGTVTLYPTGKTT